MEFDSSGHLPSVDEPTFNSMTGQPVVAYQHSSNTDIENQTPTKEKTFSDSPDVKPIARETTELSATQELGQKRRYYLRVWRRTWNAAVHEGVWPRVAYSGAGIIIGIVWIIIVICLTQSQSKVERRAQGNFVKASTDIPGGVSLQGSIKQFDQVSKILTVSWSGLFQINNETKPTNLVYANDDSGLNPFILNIYRDIDTTIYNAPDGEGNNLTFPTWVVDNKTAPYIGTIGAHEWDNFDTDIEFGGTDDESSIFKQPLFGYPLDVMAGNIVFVASYSAADVKKYIWTDENNVAIPNPDNITTYVIPLSSAMLTDNPPNWNFDIGSNVTANCSIGFDTYKEIFGWNVTDPANNEFNAGVVMPCHLEIDITATRPPIVIFAVAMAVIVNWTSTLFIFVLTCEVLIMRRGWMLSGTDLLAVNFTALFALPTVRMLLPGAPDFGVLIDLVGIVPNVIVISLCITAIAVTKLNRTKPKDDDEKHKSD